VRVTRATDAAHPAGSLRLAQIRARGGFLDGSRCGKAGVLARTGCGAGERAQVQRSGRGGSGQRSRGWREEEEDDPDMWGRRISESREGRSAAGLGRGKQPAQEGGGERKRLRTQAFGPGKRKDGEAVRAGG
jgi:hypothetical protein